MKIDEYVTHSRPFAEINEGFHDMHVSDSVVIVIVTYLIDLCHVGWGLYPLRSGYEMTGRAKWKIVNIRMYFVECNQTKYEGEASKS